MERRGKRVNQPAIGLAEAAAAATTLGGKEQRRKNPDKTTKI